MAFAILFFLAALAILFLIRNRVRGKLPPSPLALPVIGHIHLLGPLIHQCFRHISSRYGPLVYLQLGFVPCVVASSPDLARELLKTHENSFSNRNQTLAIKRISNNSTFVFGPIGPHWKFLRKLSMRDLLGGRMLNQYQPLRTKELRFFLQLLLKKSSSGQPVNLTQELLDLISNIISQMMFSIRCSGTDSQAEETRDLLCSVATLYGSFNVSDFIWLCRNLDLQGLQKKMDDVHKRFDAFLEKIIEEREVIRKRKLTEEKKDFLDSMLDAVEDENSDTKLTRNHVKALIVEFITAGSDTTAVAMEWGSAELINHPEVLEKARKEVDEVVGKNRLVEESDLDNLPYLQAIIKETLRLHPAIPLIPRKSTEDCNVQGYRITAETLLFINTWAIGRDPEYWERPLEFLPELFLPEYGMGKESSRDFKGRHFELLTFGTGRRSCPGMSLAVEILPLTLAVIIQCFDMKVAGAGEGNGNVGVDMSEGTGISAPRVFDLVCMPVARLPDMLGTLRSG